MELFGIIAGAYSLFLIFSFTLYILENGSRYPLGMICNIDQTTLFNSVKYQIFRNIIILHFQS